jgi:hypothetical protein
MERIEIQSLALTNAQVYEGTKARRRGRERGKARSMSREATMTVHL